MSRTERIPRRGRLLLTGAGLITIVVVLVVLPRTGKDEAAPSSAQPAPGFATVEASERLPSETLREWVTYADQLSVVVVRSERSLPPPEQGTSGGYIGRSVSLSIERPLWSRPGADVIAGTVEVKDFGWLERGDERVPAAPDGGTRLEVGYRYLLPLVRLDGEVATLSSTARLALEDGLVTGRTQQGDPVATVRAFAGKRPADVAQTLRQTAQVEGAGKYRDLSPEDRFQAIERDAR